MRKIVTLSVLALLVMLAIPTASAALNTTYYFDPPNGVATSCGNTVVRVMAHAPYDMNVAEFAINSSPCIDIVGCQFNPAWTMAAWNGTTGTVPTCWGPGHDWFSTWGMVNLLGPDVWICNITINCTDPTCTHCVSHLNFTCGLNPTNCMFIAANTSGMLQHNYTNGNFTCGTPSTVVDLTVSDITVNYDRDANGIRDMAIGPRLPGTRTQCNNISVDITELDGVNVGPGFHVKLEINGVEPSCSPMWVPPGMAGGSTVTVYCDCFRPIADVLYNISATVDSGGVVIESNETNNTGWENLTAITHGYKGNGWQDGRNVSALQCHDKGPINLTYSHGDSYYLSGYSTQWNTYTVNWTSGNLSIPANSAIKKARLYAYYHGDGPGDKYANLSLVFDGEPTLPVEHYSDGKTFDPWDYSSDYGVLVYNVTDNFTTQFNSGGYPHEAILTDNNPPGVGSGRDRNVTMEGMVLAVVYENSTTEPERIIWINEGCDLISSKYYSRYGVSPEEATTYAAFPGCEPIPTSLVTNATLISITQCGNQGGVLNKLDFNGHMWQGLFPSGYVPGTNLGIHEADVNGHLTPTDNVATYQDNGDSFAAANSFLIVELQSEVLVEIDPCPASICADPACRTTVNITLRGIADYGSGTIDLYYDNTVVNLVDVGLGDSMDVDHNSYSSGGKVWERISASNTDGLSGDVIFATVTFAPAAGVTSGCTDLNPTVLTLYDRNYTALQNVTVNCTCPSGGLHITESDPPVVTACDASPPVILNDTTQMRGRKLGTNVTNLSVNVADATSVEAVYVNLTPILGNPVVNNEVPMTGPNGDPSGVWYRETNASFSNLTPYCLNVMAVDFHGNWENNSCITLEVQRRGDVAGSDADNEVRGLDYYRIARWTVGLDSEPNTLRGNVVPAESWDGIDMADALYIAMYVVHGPPMGNYPAP